MKGRCVQMWRCYFGLWCSVCVISRLVFVCIWLDHCFPMAILFSTSQSRKCLGLSWELFISCKYWGCYASYKLWPSMFCLGYLFCTSVCMMEWSMSLSRSASSSSSGNRSGGSQRSIRNSEAASLMLSNFPPPRSYGSLLTYYRFVRNGTIICNNQVLLY